MADNVEEIAALPEPLHTIVVTAFSDALSDVFLAAVTWLLTALVAAFPTPKCRCSRAPAPRPADPEAQTLLPTP